MKKQDRLFRVVLFGTVLLLLGMNRSFSQTLGAYAVNDSVAAAHPVPAVRPVLADEAHDQPAAGATNAPAVAPRLAAGSDEKDRSEKTPGTTSPAKPKDEN